MTDDNLLMRVLVDAARMRQYLANVGAMSGSAKDGSATAHPYPEPGKIEFLPDVEPVPLRLARRILDMAEAGKGLSLTTLAEEIERWWSPLVEVNPEPAEHDQRVVDLARQMAHAAMVGHESVWGSPRLAAARACLDEVERLGKRAGHAADNNQAMLHAIHTWRRMHQPAKGNGK